MDLSVVILNYNSEGFLERCLDSIRRFYPDRFLEIVVVDNGSTGRSAVRRICSSFDVDRVIENSANLGVAAGRNQGVRASSGNIACTLDVDTVITARAFDELAIAARAEGAGVCGPRLCFPNGELQYTCRRFPTIFTKLLRLKPCWDSFHALDFEEMRAADHSEAMEVDWVIGACQCYPRSVFEELRGYKVFSRFGSEDIDFCLRAWLSGKRVQYVSSAQIFHCEQRIARSLTRPLTASHVMSLVKFFSAHGYAFRRQRLYRRIAKRNPYFVHGRDGAADDRLAVQQSGICGA